LSHFAIIDMGRAGYEIVPLTPEANAYMAKCRGSMKYSKRNIANSAVKRMEATLSNRIKDK
jgi:hypothetical protein